MCSSESPSPDPIPDLGVPPVGLREPVQGTTPAGLRIALATVADAELVAALVHELADFEHLASECTITADAVREHLLGPQRSADALIAWLGTEPAGFAVYYRTFSTFVARPGVFLEDLFVRPAFRHRGIGRALLKEVGRIAHCAGAGRYEWTTLNWNENARRLYASIGAREMNEWLLLRLDGSALANFACAGPRDPHDGCRCGGSGSHHRPAAPNP
jgi:GNAT superfamily N-acetyltransferase